ncbi:hypothetical protein TRAPUB_2775 [Trametes pubescens]|uniref:F-box domain-containing protein n=1 Tax=Trametes pubescens TaxID=154538 RepID=A0A1M2VFK4_TRAPU|nr:hypothetical protein TRAPUB_2775 [Trametes pubescens]
MAAEVSSDFTRFFTYSRRVKRLGISRGLPCGNIAEGYALTSPHKISFAVWDSLSAFGPRPLLPNIIFIHHKEWLGDIGVDWRKVSFHSADLLFGPRLRKVEVACVDPYLDFMYATEVIRNLSYIATSVEELSIEVDTNVYELPIPTTGYLSGTELSFLGRLTSFSSRTVCVAPDALIALATLPFLETLLIRANVAEYPWDAMPHGDRPPPPQAHFKALCVAIGSLPSSRSIVDLSITLVHSGRNYPRKGIYRSEDIAPLLSLLAVQRLIISGDGCTTILDDAALEALSQSCPDLVELVLETRPRFREEQYRSAHEDLPTPWGLVQLARGCPHITKLALAVDLHFSAAYYADPNLQLAWTTPVYRSVCEAPALQEFDATGSLFGDPMSIASFLSLLFPQLGVIWNHAASRGARGMPVLFHAWFTRVRRQERAWALKERMRLREPDSSEA